MSPTEAPLPALAAQWSELALATVPQGPRPALVVVDSHTEGNPTRIIVGGVSRPDHIVSVADTRGWLRSEADWIRTRLVHEPRGGALTCAVLPIFGGTAGDVGAVILEPGSYPPMCGHCMIGFGAVAAELGLVPELRCSREGLLRVETPAGLVDLKIGAEAHGARAVTLTNVLSYVVDRLECDLDHGGRIQVELLFGGDYYLTIDADALGFELDAASASKIVALANEVRAKLTRESINDPMTGERLDVYQVMFFQRIATGSPAARVVVVAPPGVIDRSPCGTGTSALLASLTASGELTTADLLSTRSIVGGTFTARAAESETGARGGIRPMVTGTAFVTGISTVFADVRDPLGDGFPPLV